MICSRACHIFNIGPYINDLEEGITNKIVKFTDDTKLFFFRKIKGNGDKHQLHDDIDKLIK